MNPFLNLSPAAFALAVAALFVLCGIMLMLGYIIGVFSARCKLEEELLEVADRAYEQGKAAVYAELADRHTEFIPARISGQH